LRYIIDIYYQLPIDKIGLGYKGKSKKELGYKIIDLEQKMLEFEDPFEGVVDQDDVGYEDLSL